MSLLIIVYHIVKAALPRTQSKMDEQLLAGLFHTFALEAFDFLTGSPSGNNKIRKTAFFIIWYGSQTQVFLTSPLSLKWWRRDMLRCRWSERLLKRERKPWHVLGNNSLCLQIPAELHQHWSASLIWVLVRQVWLFALWGCYRQMSLKTYCRWGLWLDSRRQSRSSGKLLPWCCKLHALIIKKFAAY